MSSHSPEIECNCDDVYADGPFGHCPHCGRVYQWFGDESGEWEEVKS